MGAIGIWTAYHNSKLSIGKPVSLYVPKKCIHHIGENRMKKFSSLKSLFVCTLLFSAVVTGCSSKTGNADAKVKLRMKRRLLYIVQDQKD